MDYGETRSPASRVHRENKMEHVEQVTQKTSVKHTRLEAKGPTGLFLDSWSKRMNSLTVQGAMFGRAREK